MFDRFRYLVSSIHVSPKYCFDKAVVEVTKDSDGYSASHPQLGCGKYRATADAAIRHLFSDNECAVTAIEECRKEKVYVRIAILFAAIINCRKSNNYDWLLTHTDRLNRIIADHMPSGSGFDGGTSFDWEKSTPEKLVFNTGFHHMNDVGMYDGWTDHVVTVRPSLVHGFTITVSGRDRNGIKQYIAETFSASLETEIYLD